jgi:CRISPR-associated protein (TIGR02584 family)
LLAVSGLSPQIITETLYGLAIGATEEQRFIPNEVHVVTTVQGAERIRLLLLSDTPGWFHRMRQDFDLPQIQFDNSTIHIIEDGSGAGVSDIRNAQDNTLVADKLTRLIAGFTHNPETALHVSIAGGRKTMGFFAGYALSLFARPQDRLSHVLVSPEFESHPEFFYPTPYQHIIIGRDHANTPLDAYTAKVELADLPVVSLRNGLPDRILAGEASYSDAVMQARKLMAPASIWIDPCTSTLLCADIAIPLTPRDFAFYLWFVRRLKCGNEEVHPTESRTGEEYLQCCEEVMNAMDSVLEKTQLALATGMSAEYFRQRRSTTNATLRKTLGTQLAQTYIIASLGRNNNKRYALTIPDSSVTVGGES